jgi:uncharacterized protein
MTPQESSMVEDLVRKVQETQLTEKDPEAEQLLRQGLARDPDAIYKLAQTVLVQNLALSQARTQIQQLQQTQPPPQPARATSFLGGLLGHRKPVSPSPQPPSQEVPYQQVPASQAPQYATVSPSNSSPAGSFLRSAATTAAGVAAGALAFEGIESLIHGFGYGGREWGGSGFGSGGPAVEETVINNYYDDPQRSGPFGEHREREASYEQDQADSRAGLEDASDQGDDSDPSSFDDSQTDDSDSDFGGGDDGTFS